MTGQRSQPNVADTSEPALVSSAPVSTPVQVSFTTNRFPAWMDRHHTWVISAVAVMTMVTLLCVGWAPSPLKTS